ATPSTACRSPRPSSTTRTSRSSRWSTASSRRPSARPLPSTCAPADRGPSPAGCRVFKVNTTLEVVNLESNDIAGAGIKAIAANTTLTELKLTNQRQMTGTDAERQLAVAFETNQTIVKLVLPIKDAGSRFIIDKAIQRNQELARKKRLATK